MELEIHGARLHCEVRGAGKPLLLLHGGTGIGADWDHLFPEPPAGYSLIVPDLRGHGRSTNPQPGFTIRQLADDMRELLDQLSIDQCDAIGMSLGAKTLLHLATSDVDRIKRMVLVSAAPFFPETARTLMSLATPDSYDKVQWDAMREKHAHGDEQILALWTQMHAFKDSYTDLNFTPPLLAQITASTFVVHGDSDPLYPVTMAMDIFQSIPNSQLWVIPGGGHVPIFGEIAPRFVEAALLFLQGESV